VGWGGKPVENALEFAEAVASLGTDRGIESFQRYSMIKRGGDSFLALPLGRVPVRERRDTDLLEELTKTALSHRFVCAQVQIRCAGPVSIEAATN
jgi:CRISPR-associated protein Csx17